MLIIIFLIIILIKKKEIDLQILPKKFNNNYKLATAFVLIFLIIIPFITGNFKIYGLLSLFYNAIVTVIFEEVIFRGFIFKEISLLKNDLTAYFSSSILFGI